MDASSMFKISYGLYCLTAEDKNKFNGCIINTLIQVTASPLQVAICVNKLNHTHDLIMKEKAFNVSVLTQSTPFSLFERFGFASGRDTDKFSGFDAYSTGANALPYLTEHCNAFFGAVVTQSIDCGTHTMFIATVTQARVLSDEKSLTYEYYFANIKPRRKPEEEKKKGWVCKICGYVHEDEVLPEDFICPICKHPASDFEKIV